MGVFARQYDEGGRREGVATRRRRRRKFAHPSSNPTRVESRPRASTDGAPAHDARGDRTAPSSARRARGPSAAMSTREDDARSSSDARSDEEADARDDDDDDARDPREWVVAERRCWERVRARIAMADARVTTDGDGRWGDDARAEASAGTSAGTPTREAMEKLDSELRRIVNSLKTTPQDDAKRQALMNKFKTMIGSRFEGVRVAPFGSYVSAFHSAGSDIDISLQIDKNGPWYDEKEEAQARRSQRGGVRARRQQRQGRTKRAQLLRKVASELRYRNYRDVQLISKARVPLIKFKDPHTGVACDVCIENDGVYKSAVLGVVADIDQRYRDLVFLIKLWAKHYDVNNAMEGSFNSYSLCLLCMHHLQRRPVPILPPTMLLTLPRPDLVESEKRELEEHLKSEDDQFDTWKVSKARVVSDASRDIAAVKYRADKLAGFGKENTETLAELFVSFFAHLCAIKDLFRNAVNASTYHGTFIVGSSWQAFKYPLGVEDPFAAGDNVARAVQMRTRDYVLNAFPAACADISKMLHATDNVQFMRSLLCLLGDKSVPPEVLARLRPTLPGMGGAPQPPGLPGAPRPPQGPPVMLQQPAKSLNEHTLDMLARQVAPGASAEEILAMLTRQRQVQAEAQRDQSQPSEQQMLLLRRQQELLRMEQAKIQQHMQQGQPPPQPGRTTQIPVASLFGQPQQQPQQQRGLPPGFGPTSQLQMPPPQPQMPMATPLPSFGAPPPANGGFSNGGLGGGVFSSIASGGGGLFFDAPARQSNPPPPTRARRRRNLPAFCHRHVHVRLKRPRTSTRSRRPLAARSRRRRFAAGVARRPSVRASSHSQRRRHPQTAQRALVLSSRPRAIFSSCTRCNHPRIRPRAARREEVKIKKRVVRGYRHHSPPAHARARAHHSRAHADAERDARTRVRAARGRSIARRARARVASASSGETGRRDPARSKRSRRAGRAAKDAVECTDARNARNRTRASTTRRGDARGGGRGGEGRGRTRSRRRRRRWRRRSRIRSRPKTMNACGKAPERSVSRER